MKLTDTHLVILNVAAQHEGGAVLPLPKSIKLNKASVARVLASMLKHKLLAEKAVSVGAESWRQDKEGHRFAPFITKAGVSAICGEAERADAKAAGAKKGQRATDKKTKRTETPNPRAGTKLSALIALLERKNGATIDEAVKTTGWQPHSVRGAISGALKKKLGLDVESERVEGRGRVYRIAA